MKPKVPQFSGQKHHVRSLALQVLLECQQGGTFVQEVLDQHLSQTNLSPPDRRLATQLANGVLCRRGTLDALLRPLIRRRSHQVEPWLRDILRLGAFQLALTHIPAHVVLHETVELAADFGRARARGFINGVLRALVPLVTDERMLGPAADALPLEKGVYRKLAKPVLPDPAVLPVEYLAGAFALPRWLVGRWRCSSQCPIWCWRRRKNKYLGDRQTAATGRGYGGRIYRGCYHEE